MPVPISEKRIYKLFQCADNMIILYSECSTELCLAGYDYREF